MKRVLLVAALFVLLPATALAHLERPSYWPDPASDKSVTPPAGGAVPTARSFGSAVTGAGPGEVRVVCQKNSLSKALRSIKSARKKGFRIRPSQPKIRYSKARAARMAKANRTLRKECRYRNIQPAIDASGNNDRVVIMPGRYTEPRSRKAPVNDPRCNPSLLQQDASGDATPSYEYQVTCPHDQNLLYVQGRALAGEALATPSDNRQGIPEQELGKCVRCNLQVEGSGVKPTDVVLDAGRDYQGKGIEAKPLEHAKDVVFRVDRADGFVGRNMLFRGALEFGFYVEETDGVLLDKTKFFWNADYGHLSFTTDHNRIQNCDGFGSGDAVVYPGASPETGAQADKSFYPDAPRINTVVTKCDLRGSELGYSGSMGNAVRITNNHIYGNTTGIASDTLSAAGHPGFPADSAEIDHNYIYANNFNVYADDSKVEPLVTVPVGTGIIYAGMNSANVHDNWIFDNWRYGTMLFAVPDALTNGFELSGAATGGDRSGAEGNINDGIACPGAPENGVSTSCGNSYYDNKVGQVPPGFRFPKALDQFGAPHSALSAKTMPNGTDFWWDEFTSNTGNCWYDNRGPDGTAASVTGSGEAGRAPSIPSNPLPDCNGGKDPGSSTGNGDLAKEAYLVECSMGPDKDTGPLDCDWWSAPAKPGTAEARRSGARRAAAAAAYAKSPEAAALRDRIAALLPSG
ncbi:MAG: right-handed parallel beta-helix repeat-containing protein [Solirubrobacteraceae bacterium]